MDAWPLVLVFLLMIGIFIWLVSFLYRMIRSMFVQRKGRVMVCLDCGTRAQCVEATRGSTGIELALWLFFLVPGLIYSIWRLSSRAWVCPTCGSARLAPPDTPAAKRAMRDA